MEKIKFILTLENSSNLELLSYTIDFEKALINATEKIFPDIRQIGCFYHYCRNIREKAIEYGILKKNMKVLGK